MPDPMVSAVIPAYNGERFLRQAIDSALAQTYPSIEVIVIDDGSTDGTPEILLGYGRSIRVFRQENAGQAAARNFGIARSAGQWIAFLDQDDLWDPTKLAVQLEKARERDDVIHSNSRVVDASGRVLRDSRKKPKGLRSPSLAEFIRFYPLSICTTLVRREAILAVGGFDASNRFGTDDMQLWLALVATGHQFRYVDEVLASYRRHGANASMDVARMVNGSLYALEQTQQRYPRVFTPEVLRACRVRMYGAYFDAGWSLLVRGDYERAAELFLKSTMHRPLALKPWIYMAASRLPFRGYLIPRLRAFVGWCRREA